MSGIPTAHGDGQRYRLLAFMRKFVDQHKYSPTIADMSRALSMHRTSIVWHLGMLRDEGEIDFQDGKIARSLQVKGRVK